MAPKKIPKYTIEDDPNPQPKYTIEDDPESSPPSSGNWFDWQDKADKKISDFMRRRTAQDVRDKYTRTGTKPLIENNTLDEINATGENVARRALGGAVSTFVHPINTVKGVADLAVEVATVPLGADDTGRPIDNRIKEFQKEYARSPREAIENLTGDLLGIYVSGKMLDAAGEPIKPVTSAMKRFAAEKAAPGLIGRLIRPMAADVRFNKDPVSGILAEGIVGNDLIDIGDKVSERMGEVGRELDRQASLPQNATKVVDVKSALKPIDDAMAEAAKAGRTDVWTKLKDLREQLTYNWKPFKTAKGESILRKTTPRNLNMTPAEALKFKRMVGDQVRWTQDPLQGDVNQAAGAVFRSLKDSLNQAVPALKGLNERYSNLAGAAKAIQRRIPVEARNAQWSLSDIALGATGHIPLAIARKVAGSAPVTTRVAGALYRAGKSAPKSSSGVMPSIKKTAVGAGGVLNGQPKSDQPSNPPSPPQDENEPQSSVTPPVSPRELMDQARKLNPAAQGQTEYTHVAVNPNNGHRIGTNDNGKTWFDVQSGQTVAA